MWDGDVQFKALYDLWVQFHSHPHTFIPGTTIDSHPTMSAVSPAIEESHQEILNEIEIEWSGTECVIPGGQLDCENLFRNDPWNEVALGK